MGMSELPKLAINGCCTKLSVKESLSSSRRDIISTADYSDNLDVPSVRELEATRRVNKPGTEEWSTARERKADLSAWNSKSRS